MGFVGINGINVTIMIIPFIPFILFIPFIPQKMEQIGQIINKRLNQHQIGDSARASEVIFKANQYLSTWLKCEKEDVKAVLLKEGILHIGSASAVWSQETRNISDPLLKKLQDEYGKTYVKKILIKSLTIK